MQLYAKIKKSSKYFNQNRLAEMHGEFPFPVTIDPDKCYDRAGDDYPVQGGPGGQYRFADVNLFIKRSDGHPVKIS